MLFIAGKSVFLEVSNSNRGRIQVVAAVAIKITCSKATCSIDGGRRDMSSGRGTAVTLVTEP